MSHAQQILESRNIFQLNVVELQCNQVDDWLGAPPEIPVIFGAYVYSSVAQAVSALVALLPSESSKFDTPCKHSFVDWARPKKRTEHIACSQSTLCNKTLCVKEDM